MRGLFDTTVVSVYSYRAALLESPSHVFWDKHGTLNYIAKERAVRHAKVSSSFTSDSKFSQARCCELSNFDVFEIHQITEFLFGSIRTVFRSSLTVAKSRGFIAVHPSVILIAIVTCTYRVSSSAVDIDWEMIEWTMQRSADCRVHTVCIDEDDTPMFGYENVRAEDVSCNRKKRVRERERERK